MVSRRGAPRRARARGGPPARGAPPRGGREGSGRGGRGGGAAPGGGGRRPRGLGCPGGAAFADLAAREAGAPGPGPRDARRSQKREGGTSPFRGAISSRAVKRT